ncbi:MAG: hypothetical protein Q9M26_04165 [Mariprofundales bacterium]|nr:hypothetical protein [Mariprofundales bacterium]
MNNALGNGQGEERKAELDMAIGAKRLLVTAGVVLLLLIVVLFWQHQTLMQIYSGAYSSEISYVLNGLIVALFVLGIVRLLQLLLADLSEENALYQALGLLPTHPDLLASSLPPHSLIAQRVRAMTQMYAQQQPMHHDALASALVARYGSRLTTPRFVHGSLILCGVFGTIVSLSLALVGASDLLSTVNSSGMGMVIHGMSTALSTTMTAIVCYLFFTWLLHSVADVETRLLAAVEEFTVHHLLPQFHVSQESINHQLAELLMAMGQLVQRMDGSAAVAPDLIVAMAQLGEQQQRQHEAMMAALAQHSDALRQGFRLE